MASWTKSNGPPEASKPEVIFTELHPLFPNVFPDARRAVLHKIAQAVGATGEVPMEFCKYFGSRAIFSDALSTRTKMTVAVLRGPLKDCKSFGPLLEQSEKDPHMVSKLASLDAAVEGLNEWVLEWTGFVCAAASGAKIGDPTVAAEQEATPVPQLPAEAPPGAAPAPQPPAVRKEETQDNEILFSCQRNSRCKQKPQTQVGIVHLTPRTHTERSQVRKLANSVKCVRCSKALQGAIHH